MWVALVDGRSSSPLRLGFIEFSAPAVLQEASYSEDCKVSLIANHRRSPIWAIGVAPVNFLPGEGVGSQPAKLHDTRRRPSGRCYSSSRKALSSFQHASCVHHPTVGAREWHRRRVAVLGVPCWAVQGATAVVTRGPSRHRVRLALCVISPAVRSRSTVASRPDAELQ